MSTTTTPPAKGAHPQTVFVPPEPGYFGTAPTTPTPDYGEPWKESPTWNSVGTANRKIVLYEASDMNEPYRSRAIACVNACAGMADPAKEIAAMREAISEAHKALTIASRSIVGYSYKNAQSALAKLQPFTTP